MKVFAAVRETEGREWVDVQTVGSLSEVSADIARSVDDAIPGWALVNPVVRIARFSLSEVTDG